MKTSTHNLLLLRHGKSDWRVPVSDFDRPLNKRGILGAASVGNWLHANNMSPSLVISSSAKRALNSAQLACEAMGLDESKLIADDDLYLASAKTISSIIRHRLNPAERLMLVGHNPGFDDWLIKHVDNPPFRADGKLMTTANLAMLEVSQDLTQVKLLNLLRPEDL